MSLLLKEDSHSHRYIQVGDLCIIYEGKESFKAIVVGADGWFQNRFGRFEHSDLVGKAFGSKIYGKVGDKVTGYIIPMWPTHELWSEALHHRTQIVREADVAYVLLQLELRPGKVVLEAGTGSGAMTTALARIVAPMGHCYTFEFNAMRAQEANKDFAEKGLSHLVTCTHRDVCETGWSIPGSTHALADAAFVDLPSPWNAVGSLSRVLRPNAPVCTYSPCIEQVQRTCTALREAGFVSLVTVECLRVLHEVKEMTTKVVQDGNVLLDESLYTDGPASAAAANERTEPQPPSSTTGSERNDMVVDLHQDDHANAGPLQAPTPTVSQLLLAAVAQRLGREIESPAGSADLTSPSASKKRKIDGGATSHAATALADEAQAISAPVPSPPTPTTTTTTTTSSAPAPVVPPKPTTPSASVAPINQTSTSRKIVTTRPLPTARGHTAYLTFARKGNTGGEASAGSSSIDGASGGEQS